MNFMFSAVKKDLIRRLREPWVVVFWIGIPLMLGGLLTIMMGGDGGSAPTARLLIADRDESVVSGLVDVFFNQGQLAKLINTEAVSLEEGRTRIDAGEASALLVIPEGFGGAVLASEQSTLTLWVNPAQQVLPAIIEESLSLLVDGAFYAQQIFGDEAQIILGSLETEDVLGSDLNPMDVGRIAEIVNGKMNQLASFILPPLI